MAMHITRLLEGHIQGAEVSTRVSGVIEEGSATSGLLQRKRVREDFAMETTIWGLRLAREARSKSYDRMHRSRMTHGANTP